jgi:dephospho-CoA kinase
MSLVVAITGGIGTGKTSIADIIRLEDFDVISSDSSAGELMKANKEIQKKLKTLFGNEIYLEDGNINKPLLSSLIFGDTEKHKANLTKLNSIVHPLVIEKMIETVQSLEDQGKKLIFVESALTFEANLDDGFDYIIVADAPEEVCIERAMSRSGLSREEVLWRMDSQMSQKDKTGFADFVISNSGSKEELKKSVDFVLNVLKEL